MKTKIIICLFLFLSWLPILAQQSKEEILEKKITNSKNDTDKINALIKLSMVVTNNNFKKAIDCAQQALDMSKKINYANGMAGAYNGFADAYWYHSDFEKAQLNYFKAFRINDSIGNEKGVALSLYNIGWILVVQQKNYNEMGYLYRSLAVFQKIQDTADLIQIYNAIGSAYSNMYGKENKKPFYDSSLKYFNMGVKTGGGSGKFNNGVARLYGNMSDLFASSGDFNSALFYIERGMNMLQKNDTASYMMSNLIKGNFLLLLKSYKESKKIFEDISKYAIKHDMKDLESSAWRGLASCNYYLGDYKQAFDQLENHINLSEKISKEAYSTDIKELQGQYSLEKTEASLKEVKQSSEIEKLKNKQNSYFIFILLGVAIVVIVVAVLLFRQNKLKQSANVLLQEQNTIITQKKQEIEHSIQYAKGIQTALLPEIKDIKNVFPEGFIYYLPKDVVSGDFYWFHKVGDYFYLAAADCTGHGVPGALMSIVSMDKITQAIFEKKLNEPKEILKFLNIEIKKALKQHNGETKQRDGLDIAFVRINTKTNSLDFASANRPLYIISNSKLTEHKADKVAIAGFTPDDHDFKQLSLQLNKGDSLYLSTDGYADQFGGGDSKKFMTKNFKALLESVSKNDMNSQEKQIMERHQEWRGNYEQVDDILVIGIKI